LLPSQIYGGSGADHRLPIALFLLLTASSAPRFPSRRAAIMIGTMAVSVLVIRLAIIERVWRQADMIYSADLVGIDALPPGTRLAVAYPASAINFATVPEAHLATLAIPRREAFVPTLFALPTQQPVMMRPLYATLAAAAQPQQLWAAFVGNDAAGLERLLPLLEQYDYIVFTDHRPLRVPPSRCLRPEFEQPTFQIFAIVHMPNCASPEG
jgi:hypothetical protein